MPTCNNCMQKCEKAYEVNYLDNNTIYETIMCQSCLRAWFRPNNDKIVSIILMKEE